VVGRGDGGVVEIGRGYHNEGRREGRCGRDGKKVVQWR